MVEDDAQDGPDHVDAHRSPAFLVSAYTKRKMVVHTFYTTMNVLRTIEDLLGLNHLGMNDANSDPMSDVFTAKADLTPYEAVLPGTLCQPPVAPDLIPECQQASIQRTPAVRSLHEVGKSYSGLQLQTACDLMTDQRSSLSPWNSRG